jgi:hypothetical protein
MCGFVRERGLVLQQECRQDSLSLQRTGRMNRLGQALWSECGGMLKELT